MEAMRAWLQDRKNLPIVVAGTGIIIIVVALVFLKLTGTIGGGRPTTAQTGIPAYPQPGTPAPEGYPPQPGTPAPESYPPQPGAPAAEGVPPGAQPAPPGAEAPPPPPTEAAALTPMLPYRKDPFAPFSGVPKKKDVLAVLLPSVSRPRLAPAPVTERSDWAAEEVLPPQPYRRMAGVLWNGKVSAILETNGQADIVRPGMELTRGNSRVRVESIQPNCIILKTLDTRMPMTVKVNLAGSVIGVAAGPAQPGYMAPPSSPIYPSGPSSYMGQPGTPAPM